MTSEVPYNFSMIGTSSASTATTNSGGEMVGGMNQELLHEGPGNNNNSNNNNSGGSTNTQDVLSLLNYLVPNSGGESGSSGVNPPPQIADPTTLNELLGLISGAVTSNPSGVKGSPEPALLDNTGGGNMTNSIPYLLPLLMSSGSNNDQNVALLNSLVSSTGVNGAQPANLNQFVNQLQNLLPPLVPGGNATGISNNQPTHTGTTTHHTDHLQLLYGGGGGNLGTDNKSELLAAAAAFAASNVTPLNAGPISNSRGRARKRTSTTPLGGMRGRRESNDISKRRVGSPGRNHGMDNIGTPGTMLPHIPSLAGDGMENLDHGGNVNLLNTPANHHGSQYNEFSTEDARHSVRFENGLVLMTKRFIQYLYEQGESRIIDLAAAEAHMDVQRRRLYDITNVLEGIGILKKMGRNAFMCAATVPDVLIERDAVLSSFGTVDMSVKLSGNIDDESLNSIPWFHSYNKLQVLSNAEYEMMEKTLIQRKEQLLQACQQLGFTDIVDQYTIASASTSHTAGANVANYGGATPHSGRPNHVPRNSAGSHGISLNHGHLREDNISVPNTMEQGNESNNPSGGAGALWGSIMGGSNRASNVPSIHHPDARWIEAPDTTNHSSNAPKHHVENENSNTSVAQNDTISGFNE
ncbi:transcription factor E2f, putative [Cryptosporidium muris RN66]|uniref:Transcription factor E2f, putative n=1 Tax=Cryptosporidium muris (strain RN66) TaxID=441375 RepID=B6ADS0_CRYMR|nr:transcription factor E2f, putative [Cryptosporidium muris RN66]EEA06361.1 transcription factor E2f, putative [Cryptosporidium muris RN66]|eukprot:XP_002140710.1 transcription factor E2f [Cryptosporidium muris RN66]